MPLNMLLREENEHRGVDEGLVIFTSEPESPVRHRKTIYQLPDL